MLPGQSGQLRRQRSLDRTSHTCLPKAVNDQQDSLPVAASILNLYLQLLHRLSNSLARMGDVYLSHGVSHKGCLTSADANASLVASSGARNGYSGGRRWPKTATESQSGLTMSSARCPGL